MRVSSLAIPAPTLGITIKGARRLCFRVMAMSCVLRVAATVLGLKVETSVTSDTPA